MRRAAAWMALVLVFCPGTIASAKTIRDCRDCPAMVVVPAGSFLMGSPDSEKGRAAGEGPQHKVTIAQSFAIGEFDVTRVQYAEFVSSTGRKIDSPKCDWADPKARGEDMRQKDNEPAVCVSWNDTKAYAAWLSTRTGHRYRLPSEAEWEYAARAGTVTARPWSNGSLRDDANIGSDPCCGPATGDRDVWRFTSPVGSFPPNAFGLYDMIGNVWQWTEDCAYRYADPAQKDCSRHIIRGGAWFHPPNFARSAARTADLTDFRVVDIGFRVARDLDGHE